MRFEFENTRPEMSNEEILVDLKRVASALNADTLSRESYQQHGSYAPTTVKKRFGSWNRALAAAGLRIVRVRNLPDDTLFDNLREVWITLGRQPRKAELRPPLSRYTFNPYARRFGSWLGALRTFTQLAEHDDGELRIETSGLLASGQGQRSPSLRLRFLVMRRDRFKCVLCGRSPALHPSITLHVDHVVAWANGGATELANLRTLCSQCNLGKSNLAPETA